MPRKRSETEKLLFKGIFPMCVRLKAPVQTGTLYDSSAGEVCSVYFFPEFLPFFFFIYTLEQS